MAGVRPHKIAGVTPASSKYYKVFTLLQEILLRIMQRQAN